MHAKSSDRLRSRVHPHRLVMPVNIPPNKQNLILSLSNQLDDIYVSVRKSGSIQDLSKPCHLQRAEHGWHCPIFCSSLQAVERKVGTSFMFPSLPKYNKTGFHFRNARPHRVQLHLNNSPIFFRLTSNTSGFSTRLVSIMHLERVPFGSKVYDQLSCIQDLISKFKS
jgi:hypothetical protein